MKRASIFIIMISVALLASCKGEQLTTPDFDVAVVSVTKSMVSIGEDDEESNEDEAALVDAYEVTFRFSGNPDNIVFYSGEEGSEYMHRNRYYRNATVKMQFATAFSGGTIPNTLRIMLSNDFKPPYRFVGATPVNSDLTREAVEAATWSDITNRFNLPGNRLSLGTHDTGEAVISEFYQDIPFFIGFWFDADKSEDVTLSLGQWIFSNFRIRNDYYDGTSGFYVNNVLNTYWRRLDLLDATGYTVGSNRITLNGNIVTTVEKGEEITYIPTLSAGARVVSPPFYPLLGETDKGRPLKSSNEYLSEYTHVYVNPGQTSVRSTFVITNSLYGDDIQAVRELEVFFE